MGRIFKMVMCLAVTLAATTYNTGAKVKLPGLVSDGMVLQRDTPLKIWGWADTGETVKLTFQNKTYSTRADRRGEWSIQLPALPPGGPFTMHVAGNRGGGGDDGSNEIVLREILIGDVWMCSGQSNMETFVYRVMDLYADEIGAFDYPNIRYFRVQTKTNFGRQDADAQGEWVPASTDRIANMSVLALFFAREMYDRYGVPVGLIHNAVGGSPIEAWMSPEYMQKYPGPWAQVETFSRPGYLDSLRNATTAAQAAAAGSAQRPRSNPMNDNDPGVGRWFRPEIDDSEWDTMSLPGYWSEKGVDRTPGTMWFRREVTLSAEQAAATNNTLRMGTIIDADSTWVNGTFVGNVTYQYPPRVYPVPAGVLREGRNVIATRVTSNSGGGGFVEQKPYKLFIGRDPWGQQIDRIGDPAPAGPGWEIDLSGDWKYRVGAQILPAPRVQGAGGGRAFAPRPSNNSPTGLYNGVVAPVRNYALKGFLWYQGESNTGRAAQYRDMMADLIEGWRKEWNDPLKPFLYVQLPGLKESSGYHPENDESGWAEMRDVQRQTLRIHNTGMATILDAGEWNDIHPMNKKTVAQRLALEARRVAYGEEGVSGTGPLFQNMVVEEGAAIVDFLCVGADIYPNLRLEGFQIAGVDKKYVPARAVVLRGNTVKVWNPTVTRPVAVRYAWSDNPADANLRDRDGIPASTFEASLTYTADKIGRHDGYDFELWHQRGDVAMTLGRNGTFECSWKDSHNVLFRTGKKFYPVLPVDSVGEISIDYGCDYNPGGNSYLCVYGWSVDPLVEFYVVESWGNWRPPGAGRKKGTVTIDGGTYDLYETTRVEMPSIQGTKTFQQYWSVRTDRRTEGTVSVSRHVEEWAKRGMKLGGVFEVSLCVEGYESSGEANVWLHRLNIAEKK